MATDQQGRVQREKGRLLTLVLSKLTTHGWPPAAALLATRSGPRWPFEARCINCAPPREGRQSCASWLL